MLYSFAEFRSKEVIDVGNGEKLGYVDDLEFDAQSAAVAAFVIRGRERLFGLHRHDSCGPGSGTCKTGLCKKDRIQGISC